jgi:hypothetical protein
MSIVLVGSTSGSCTLQEQAVAGTTVLTLPVGTGTVVANNVNSAIVSGTAVSASSTSVDFTSIPSWVKRITIMFQDVSTSGTSAPMIQVGTGGTPTTSGYNISYSQLLATPAQNTSSATTSGIVIFSNNASYAFSGFITACNITGNSWTFNGIVGNKTTTSQTSLSAGSISLAGVLNIVRITTVGGTDTFDAGTINILYE